MIISPCSCLKSVKDFTGEKNVHISLLKGTLVAKQPRPQIWDSSLTLGTASWYKWTFIIYYKENIKFLT